MGVLDERDIVMWLPAGVHIEKNPDPTSIPRSPDPLTRGLQIIGSSENE